MLLGHLSYNLTGKMSILEALSLSNSLDRFRDVGHWSSRPLL